jgi:FAD dependent oxidoreductase TIGR03364
MDDLVVGAGILGLAHAYHLARKGRRVTVVERGRKAVGASCRNFGMVWPIGQPAGAMENMAVASRGHWLAVLRDSGLWHDMTGSLHLAYHDDEAAVLEEYQAHTEANSPDVAAMRRILSPAEIAHRAPRVRTEGLECGLWSETEVCVDPRQVIWELPAWLNRKFGVEFRFGSVALPLADGRWRVGPGETANPGRVWVCSGEDFETLYPEVYAQSGLIKCKLQMMRAHAPAAGERIGPMLAAGLTLGHYKSFSHCPSLTKLRSRFAREMPEYETHGIHVLVSQQGTGEITIGDSHEYEEGIEPYDKTRIDDLILRYLATFLETPSLHIHSRWNGTYAKHPIDPYFVKSPEPNVTIVNGPGGAGMTLSFGLAELSTADV